MANSPAHRFGQIIGDVLEAGMLTLLEKFAADHALYLDKKGPRPCRRGAKCAWRDLNGNSHDLDFVLERGGSPVKSGMPAAFIETAWRRYTKHSRNKAQEIQGAIEPLAETYRNLGPFKGAVLAGVFTTGALNQLKSLGFTVVYFPYESVIDVFRRFGIDAHFDETTTSENLKRKVDAYERLSSAQRKKLAATLLRAQHYELAGFMQALTAAISRQVERIVILALHGKAHEVATIEAAIRFVEGYIATTKALSVERYEIEVRYNNGNVIQGRFKTKQDAVDFLKTYQPVAPSVL